MGNTDCLRFIRFEVILRKLGGCLVLRCNLARDIVCMKGGGGLDAIHMGMHERSEALDQCEQQQGKYVQRLFHGI